MTIVLILVGALPATLFLISKLGLDTPPQAHLLVDISDSARKESSREGLRLAA
jgi:hypothetical protein